MYPAGNLFIPAPHGQLEAILKPPRDGDVRGAALVLLRINFRGVGQSTGEHDEGRAERDDARVALDYLAANYPGQEITVCGFSFGARVGMEVGIADDRVVRLISIGTPVDKYDFNFLEQLRKPVL